MHIFVTLQKHTIIMRYVTLCEKKKQMSHNSLRFEQKKKTLCLVTKNKKVPRRESDTNIVDHFKNG